MQQEEVVRRRVRDDSGYRQRRGSIKSRILQFSKKRKKEPPDKFNDNGESDSAIQSRTITSKSACTLPTLEEQDLEEVEVEVHESQLPAKRKFDTSQPVLILKDPKVQIFAKHPKSSHVFLKTDCDSDINVLDKEHGSYNLPKKSSDSAYFHQFGQVRPSELNIDCDIPDHQNTKQDTRKSLYDYSLISSCTLPSDGTAASSPSPTHHSLFLSQLQEPKVVLRRHSRNVINNTHESGRLLNSALARHFRSIHCSGNKIVSDASATILSDNLYHYIKDIFLQLDSHHSGFVSRQDFEALCEILQIDKSPVVSKRNSGLEWLSSYQPRPNTPASPIRVDRLSEAKYKHTGPKLPVKDPTSFLWTIGPRPFWELWPHKKHKKKNLTLDEFTRCLLDQWAKTHGYPLELRKSISKSKDVVPTTQLEGDTISLDHSEDDTRVQKLKRSVVRLTKRYHKIERIARKSTKDLENVESKHSKFEESLSPIDHNGNGHTNGVVHTNGHLNGHSDPIKNGASNLNGHRRDNVNNQKGFKKKKSTFFYSSKKIEKLEDKVAKQQMEIQSLTGVVEHLRSSLQLSDAQNLALQVLLKKMAKAELKLPVAETSDFRSEMKQSEQQLENLVSELKEMSQTKYPTIPSNIYSGSTCSFNGAAQGDLGIEEELTNVHESILGAQKDLTLTQKQMHRFSKQTDSKDSDKDLNMKEAYKALLETEKEINKLRSNLLEAQSSLEFTHTELDSTKKELNETKNSLAERTKNLSESDRRLSKINENRKSLLNELKSTKEVLLSSLRNVQDLEKESRKVPQLELRIEELERLFPSKRKRSNQSPEHLDDSFLFSNSESDQDDTSSKLLDQSFQDDELLFSHQDFPGKSSNLGLPPRPPSVKSKDKSFRSTTPTSDHAEFSPTPSSGHYSADSTPIMSKSPGDKSDSVIPRLRKEIDQLKKRFSRSERDWAEERNSLLNELGRRREDYGDTSSQFQDMREERIRLAIIEEKIKEILTVLKSLNSMKISNEILGTLVLEAVEKAYDDSKGEVQVFEFLNILYQSSREYERQSADNLLSEALGAVRDSNSDSSDSLGNVPEGMDTIRPRRPSSNIQETNIESVFRIDV